MNKPVSSLSDRLREQLRGLRVASGSKLASGPNGDRRSRLRGAGVEFSQRRTYQPGDDLRRLDHHAFARDGTLFVREYTLTNALDIGILIDTTRSMGSGRPTKIETARVIAHGLGYVALVGGDAVRVGLAGEKVQWSNKLFGRGQLRSLATSVDAAGASDGVGACPASVPPRVSTTGGAGLLFIISDLMFDDVSGLVSRCVASGWDTHVIHIVDPQEGRPLGRTVGSLDLVDGETGEVLAREVDRRARAEYSEIVKNWLRDVQSVVTSHRGRYHIVMTNERPTAIFLKRFTESGILE